MPREVWRQDLKDMKHELYFFRIHIGLKFQNLFSPDEMRLCEEFILFIHAVYLRSQVVIVFTTSLLS